MAIYGGSKISTKFSASVQSDKCGARYRETNPAKVKPPGSFAPTPEYPISQRKRMAGIN